MSFEITQPDAMEINVSTEDYTGYGVSCNGAFDGAIDITVTGGAGSYSYNWTDGSVVMPIGWPESLNPLDLNDGSGTETNASLMINLQPEEIVVNGSPIQTGDLIGMFYESNGEYVCAGFIVWDSTMPPAALTILGQVNNGFGFVDGQDMHMFVYDSSTGISYSVDNDWNDGGVFGFNGSGQYAANGLYQTLAMNITEYVGGVSISNAQDVSNLGAGTYSVIVTDENGCTVSAEVEITESPEMTISETHSNYNSFGVSAFGATDGDIDITVDGGTGNYTYVWSNGETTEDLVGLAAGTYSVTATDENGCSVSIEVTLTSPDELLISETHSDFTGYGVSCNGASDGFIDVTVSGGAGIITYLWSNGETTEDLDGLAAGTYSVTATDENGNNVSISVEITESDAMEISGTTLDYVGYGVSCNGESDGAINVTVVGGTGIYTYVWSNGETTEDLDGLAAGSYSVTVTDENGCEVSMS
jgi:hypothetical protein